MSWEIEIPVSHEDWLRVLLNRTTTERRKSMKSWFKVAVISAAMSRSVAMAGLFADLYTCGEVEDAEPSVPGNGKDKILRTVSYGAGMRVMGGESESASQFHFFRFDQDGCLVVFTNGYEVERAPRIQLRKNRVKRHPIGNWTNEVGFVGDAKVADKYGVFDAAWRESPWGILYDKEKEIDSNGIKSAVCEDHGCLLSDMSLRASYSNGPITKTWSRDMGKGLFLLLSGGYCCKFNSFGRVAFAGLFDGCDEGRDYKEEVDASMQENRAHWAELHGLTCKQAEDGYTEYVKRKGGVEFYRLPCGCVDINPLTGETEEKMFGGLDDDADNMLIQEKIGDIVAFRNALEKASCVYVGLSVEEISPRYWGRGKNKRSLEELVVKMREDHVWTNVCGKSLFVVDGLLDSEPQYSHGFRFDSRGRFVGYGQFQERPKVSKDED